MPRKKKKSNMYWTSITEVAIQAYNKTEDYPVKREKIYRRFLFAPLMKMCENRINQMKPDYIDKTFEDLQADLVTYLTERLCKIKPGKGRGYSYFTRTSWNYLIAENQKGYTKLKQDREPIDVDEQRNVLTELHNDDMRETLKYFMDEFIEYCYENLNRIFTNASDIHVADSVLHLFETRENIEKYNKKELYILIRERTGLQTTNITRVIKTLKNLYETKFEEYSQDNFINLPF